MSSPTNNSRYRENLQAELDSAFLYRALANAESAPPLADLYRQLAETEEQHAAFWRERLTDARVADLPTRPAWRARILAVLADRFGAHYILPTLTEHERGDSHAYARQPETVGTTLSADEQNHARMLAEISAQGKHGVVGDALARLEGRHRNAGGNALRAAVLGANDGLVSNLSLIMGVAGAAPASNAIVIAGMAGLLAGAISMAMGEWISVQSSRELYERQIALERAEIEQSPELEAQELALIYQAKGLDPTQAQQVATNLMRDPEVALDALAREELGIDPKELGGSPWEAAYSSFALFAVGAIIPLFPFLVLSGTLAVIVSVILSGLGLFLIGAGITLMTGKSIWSSGMRQVIFGLGAAAVTFTIGRIIGVSIAG